MSAFLASDSTINSCFIAGEQIVGLNCHATRLHRKKTIFTSIYVYLYSHLSIYVYQAVSVWLLIQLHYIFSPISCAQQKGGSLASHRPVAHLLVVETED
jgi:hypothetical protein